MRRKFQEIIKKNLFFQNLETPKTKENLYGSKKIYLKKQATVLGFSTFTPQIIATAKNSRGSFRHGVASGDPWQNQIILWTRVTPQTDLPIKINWQMSHNPNFKQLVCQGETVTYKESDYCVKVDAILPKEEIPGTTFYYRFLAGTRARL
ncbi:MAG: hypothetical protein Ct9H300mP4_17200 [Gammaproteobacteria bacterium]|nr:MAG: hypothetical protein Ct9H300mP4_17200 [Gammaproteobacteria bacterium]